MALSGQTVNDYGVVTASIVVGFALVLFHRRAADRVRPRSAKRWVLLYRRGFFFVTGLLILGVGVIALVSRISR
jgi:hypothetical protein